MLDGSHLRFTSITAITEDKNYHTRLLKYVQQYRRDPSVKQMVRASGSARNDPYFLLAECMFGTLPSAFRYFNRLPNNFFQLINHVRAKRVINPRYCDPWIVAQFKENKLL